MPVLVVHRKFISGCVISPKWDKQSLKTLETSQSLFQWNHDSIEYNLLKITIIQIMIRMVEVAANAAPYRIRIQRTSLEQDLLLDESFGSAPDHSRRALTIEIVRVSKLLDWLRIEQFDQQHAQSEESLVADDPAVGLLRNI